MPPILDSHLLTRMSLPPTQLSPITDDAAPKLTQRKFSLAWNPVSILRDCSGSIEGVVSAMTGNGSKPVVLWSSTRFPRHVPRHEQCLHLRVLCHEFYARSSLVLKNSESLVLQLENAPANPLALLSKILADYRLRAAVASA